MLLAKLAEFLDSHGVKYVTIKHSKAFTALEVAESAHIRGRELAKTVMVNLDGRLNAGGLQRALNRDMPPWQYTIAHPEARLSASQKQELVQGFRASLGGNARYPAPVRAATPAGLVLASYPGSGQAVAIINNRCASCHTARYALGFHTSSPARAKALVDNMVRRGARVSPADQAVLIRHFTS